MNVLLDLVMKKELLIIIIINPINIKLKTYQGIQII